jgi:anti-sigma regulatory factor (Ser/Thr protein kinase)
MSEWATPTAAPERAIGSQGGLEPAPPRDYGAAMTERRFRRALESLAAVFAFVQEFTVTHGLPETTSYDLELIAEELFTNCVKYGGGTAELAIALGWLPPEVILQVRDEGARPFDITKTAAVDTSAPIEQRHAGGLGLHLVRQIADRVAYEHHDGASTVTVVKRLED